MAEIKTEKVPLFVVYIQDGTIKTETSCDLSDLWKLYGFLSAYTELLKEKLMSDIEDRDDNDNYFEE